METPKYRYDLVMTKERGCHVYEVFLPTGERLGQTRSIIAGGSKEWLVSDVGWRDDVKITRRFKKRTDTANVMYAYWRDSQKKE